MKLERDSILGLANKALSYNKRLEEAYLVRGWCSENTENAIEEYRKALEINPNHGLAYSSLADAFWANNERINGLKYKLKSIELERGPMLQILLRELGFWFECIGFYENAIAIYNNIFQLTNDTLQYFENISGPYYAEENWEESIIWAKRILDKDPNNYWAHSQLATIYSYLQKDDLLGYHVEELLRLNKKRSVGFSVEIYQGYLLWKHGEKDQANGIIDQIISSSLIMVKSASDIEKESNYLTLAKVFSLKGEYKKAIEYIEKINFKYPLFQSRWFIIDISMDPCFQNIKSNKKYQEILKSIISNWQKEHDKVQIWLEENNLLKK